MGVYHNSAIISRMDAPLPSITLNCTQCGGELHPDEGQVFLVCPYCSSTVYLDKAKVVFHWYLAPTLDEPRARGALMRWMAGNQTVKDLDKKSHIVSHSFEYFPIWYFRNRVAGGREETSLEPAAATSVSELRKLKLPAGDLRRYSPDIEAQAHAPNVPLDSAVKWAQGRLGSNITPVEQSLVHVPLHTFKYEFKGQPYTALVEAGTGEVFANVFPAKAEAPYLAAGIATALVFLCLATFPLVGMAVEPATGLWVGAGACAAVGLILAPILFGFAAWVAAKV